MNAKITKTARSVIHRPFRGAVLRGLGVVLPPLLTIVILAWIFSTVEAYVLKPVEDLAKRTIVWVIDDTLHEIPPTAEVVDTDESYGRQFRYRERDYIRVADEEWIPVEVYQRVRQSRGVKLPETAQDYYIRYVELKYLKRHIVLPIFVLVFVLVLYLLGRFLAYKLGRVAYNAMEKMIQRLPIIRTVYTSVKQVTDFVFNETEMEFTRVVAVEYPRKGIWSVGFVTGEGMRSVAGAAGEPIVTLLMPTSPMPATGFTISVRRSETIDLDITIDQAFQFIVSCGVVVPKSEQQVVSEGIQAAIERHLAADALPSPDVQGPDSSESVGS